ncbi:hypothetical protein G9C98_005560 [Cotesia typhae]|uniref:CUB domain-containing protein n=1 Tax=Cotesia typhae TaxID=2053667 RepID=A0A8J5UUJ8_9HYME|nr:hypothetical protein G9C98_005560 [Cotesia typhae]
MLVIRRLLIVGVLAASIGHYPVAAAIGSKIGGMWWWWRPPWFISYLGFALIFHTTPGVASYHIAVTTTSSSSSQKTDLTAAGCRLSEFRSCNRTLYGDVGRTYEVEVRRPREDRLPFICHINFTAAGGDFGDLVQLTFDTFTVGRFLSFTNQGCPDGFMMIREEGRPATGGQWCGSAWGYTVYYSETASINLTLYLARLSEQGIGYNFDFKLSYKFLKRSEAHLRYGNNTLSTWRGDLVNGTYCDRVLTRCDTRACRLQSPNYPGVYPRNVTCYYRIEHKRAPPGHRALLAVNQRNSHKIHIKDQVVKYDRSQRILRVWDQCNVVQDYLTVYDGGSTTDRVLVRLCGGDTVPDIVSSRNTMLLEFHTSPYDNPFHPVPLSFLPGFELEVHVLFVDDKSRSFVKENSNCDFYITSYENPSGTLENPKHSLPPNTTCRYHFHGKPNEIVWISFIKYYSASTDPPPAASIDSLNNDDDSNNNNNDECHAKLIIWDGDQTQQDKHPASPKKKIRLMGQFCKDEIPVLCDHSLLRNSSRHTRPCSLAESYVSTGRDLTLEHILRQGSALYPISFVLRYEFVHNSMSCHLVFTSSSSFSFSSSSLGGSSWHDESVVKKSAGTSGKFSSPKNVFLYGRGGAQNLSCVYRFEAEQDQKVEISISRASFGDKVCMSYVDPLVNRWTCDRRTSDIKLTGLAELVVSEYPWPGVKLVRDCFCSNITGNADNDSTNNNNNNNYRVSLTSLTSNIVELNSPITQQHARSFVVEFIQKEPGTYSVMWIAISKSARAATDTHYFNIDGDNSAGNIFSMVPPIEDCPYRCPEIKACISSVLWCDGIKHCPSGFDEEEINCSYRFGVTLLYVAVGAGILGVFLVLLLATGCLKYCLYRHKIRIKKKKKKKKKNSLNSLNVNNIHVNHMHHHQNNGLTSSSQLQSGGGGTGGQYNITSHPQDLYTSDNYGKDSIC